MVPDIMGRFVVW